MTAPASMAAAIATSAGQPLLTMTTARIAADRPLTEPTERSISPSSRTSTMPSAMMPVAALCRAG